MLAGQTSDSITVPTYLQMKGLWPDVVSVVGPLGFKCCNSITPVFSRIYYLYLCFIYFLYLNLYVLGDDTLIRLSCEPNSYLSSSKSEIKVGLTLSNMFKPSSLF